MRKALKPGGVMTHIVWRTRNDNPWLSMAKEVVLKFLPPPGEDALHLWARTIFDGGRGNGL